MGDEARFGLLPAVQLMGRVLVIALFFTTFTVQPIRIPSASMEPTLLVGDFLLLDRQAASGDLAWVMPPAEVKRGDVVVFHDPVDDAGTYSGVHLVKRVIGMPGDRVRLRHGVVFVNEKALVEGYTVYRPSLPDGYRDDFPQMGMMDARVDPTWWIRLRGLMRDGEITVPKGDYFVLGDNRNESDDSRYWGFVPQGNVVGEPVVVYFSWKENERLVGSVWEKVKAAARWDRVFHVVR